MLPILQVGPLAIQLPGLALLVGLWIGLSLAEREAKRLTLNPDQIYNLVYIALIVGAVGARVAYVLRYASAYLADPWGVVSLNPATLALPEGLGLGLVAAWVYASRVRLPPLPTLESFAPTLAVMLVAVAASHIASGDAFGAPTQLPWRIYLWDEYRHPSQFYELAGALMVLGLWWLIHRRAPFVGFSFLMIVAAGSSVAIFLEMFRGDSALALAGLRLTQLGGGVLLAGSLILMKVWLPVTGSVD